MWLGKVSPTLPFPLEWNTSEGIALAPSFSGPGDRGVAGKVLPILFYATILGFSSPWVFAAIFLILQLFIYCLCWGDKFWDLVTLHLADVTLMNYLHLFWSFLLNIMFFFFVIDPRSWVWIIYSFLLPNVFHYMDIWHLKTFILPLVDICFNFSSLGILWIKLLFSIKLGHSRPFMKLCTHCP